jgi:GNAT superfamily N-acetyltransferase
MLLDDYLNFFDNIAFVDNSKWASCYCFFPQAPHETCIWKERTAEENRADVIINIINDKMNGFLAYDNNKPVGWCNAGPRVNMTITPDYDEPEADKIGAITCFIIAKEYRLKGVAHLLLKRACEVFKMQGFKYVEGYPMKDVEGDAHNHWGPMNLYVSEGFEEYATEDDTIVMRKTLI